MCMALARFFYRSIYLSPYHAAVVLSSKVLRLGRVRFVALLVLCPGVPRPIQRCYDILKKSPTYVAYVRLSHVHANSR